ncbi:uncharacterized protein Dwil_GK12576 [Drosophila willistoni]|uniref:Ubiquitin-like protease family profile domain-containing protein n=1 Tax=Drosophila willistoni TaxID=7260 RepID=A0A0Q9X1K9_DROWI|nr:sentrin-specific protease 6 isoform X2 [Drosophila willistoni]KRF98934.1 uncharacterized protein Dwil_GK12576 [Drosophila willistoni]
MINDDFVRGDVTDLKDIDEPEQFSTSLTCNCVRFMSMRFEVIEPITFTSKGLHIVGIISDKDRDQKFTLNIYKHEVIKVIAHLSSNEQAQPLVTLFLLRNCAQYVKTQLQITDDQQQQQQNEQTEFKSKNSVHARRLILLFDGSISASDREMIKSMFNCVDDISSLDAAQIFKGIAESDRKAAAEKLNSRQLRQNEQINLLMYPPKGTGSLCIRMEDYMCLTKESYLNDIIIDFYLLWLRNTQFTEQQRERTHIFSTFFYKRLTTLTRPTDMKQTAAQKRHARVQKWTKVVDIFDKDFIIVPINEQSHWFLAIICFPCLKGPVTYDTNQPVEPQQLKRGNRGKKTLQIGNTTITPLSKRGDAGLTATPGAEICCIPGDDESERDEAEGDESDMASDESENSQPAKEMPNPIAATATPTTPTSTTNTITSTTSTPCSMGPARSRGNMSGGGDEIPAVKQPLILIFDSLAGASRSRVVATLRDYLTCEYRVKKPDAQAHIFNKDNMPGHCVKVPQQQNFTDCGLYLLQYVEQFFSQPITDYRLPIKQLTNWFDFLTVTKKREDIAQLIQKLMDEANKQQKQRLILPLIEFPTLNGQLVEYPDDTESAEFEEEEALGGIGELEPNEDPGSEVHNETNSEAMDVDPTPVLEEAALPKTGSNSSITTTATRPRVVLKRRLQNGAAAAAAAVTPPTPTAAAGTVAIISSNGNTSESQTSQQPLTTAPSVTPNQSPHQLVTPGLTSSAAVATAAAVSSRSPSGSLKIRKIDP